MIRKQSHHWWKLANCKNLEVGKLANGKKTDGDFV